MRSICGWLFVGLVACTNVSTGQHPDPTPREPTALAPKPASTPATPPPETPPPATVTPPPETTTPPPETTTPPATTATAVAVKVEMTAATLADDCGRPPVASKAKAKQGTSYVGKGARAKRSCEQSSMQLSVVAAADGAATQLAVKKVELFDDRGARIGELEARTPSIWDASGVYQAWDQRVAPGQDLSVSYALSQPPWGGVADRRSRNYVLKAVITIGAGEQAVQRKVFVEAPTILPPGVKT